MSEKPISPLRRRTIEDLTVRNFIEKTRNDYIRQIRTFTAFLVRNLNQVCALPVKMRTDAASKSIKIEHAISGR